MAVHYGGVKYTKSESGEAQAISTTEPRARGYTASSSLYQLIPLEPNIQYG
jgi:hypothetical protein